MFFTLLWLHVDEIASLTQLLECIIIEITCFSNSVLKNYNLIEELRWKWPFSIYEGHRYK